MSDKPQPSNPSETSLVPTLAELEQLSKYSQMTTPTLDTPPTPEPTQLVKRTAAEVTSPTKAKNVLDAFESEIGGREALCDNLSLLSLDKKQQNLLFLLCDPKLEAQPLSSIARVAGVSATSIMEMFTEAAKTRSQAISFGKLARSTPNVIQDILSKSVDSTIDCPECLGLKIEGIPCPKCRDRGQIVRESDIDRQKLALEMAGILKKGPGVAVQVNNQTNLNGLSSGNFFSKWVKDTDDAAYDAPLDAEFTDDETE